MVQGILVELKSHYSHITLLQLIPYYHEKISLISGFDSLFYPIEIEKTPKRFAIVRANQAAVNYSDYLIAYVGNSVGNSRKLVEYASKRAAKGMLIITEITNDKK